jgi:hypothetical protein
MVFGTFTADNIDESIREDVLKLRNSSVLTGIQIFGFKLITETGEVVHVDV